MSLKLVANPIFILDQGLCEDFLRRESYIIQLKKNKKFSLLKSARMSKNNNEACEGTMGILKNTFISLIKFFLNLSLKLVENPIVISDQGICEDLLRRERKYSNRGTPWIKLSFKNLL